MHSRRYFLKLAGMAAPALALTGLACVPKVAAEAAAGKPFFDISLAQWSLHKAHFGNKMTNLDFPVKAAKDYGIHIVEYVNSFFKDKAKDKTYLDELLMRCKDNGVSNHLIMIDGEGDLGNPDAKERLKAIENHYKWVECAQYLGCKTIRVNAAGKGERDEIAKLATDSLRTLSKFAQSHNINVIVENHGGMSSDGQWLSSVIKNVGMPNCGTLPDFGNFCVKWADKEYGGCAEFYDPYKGVAELMPYAKAVSAKSHNFTKDGNERDLDYARLLKIVKDAGFRGIIGIEYEGETLSEDAGIRATLALLQKLGNQI